MVCIRNIHGIEFVKGWRHGEIWRLVRAVYPCHCDFKSCTWRFTLILLLWQLRCREPAFGVGVPLPVSPHIEFLVVLSVGNHGQSHSVDSVLVFTACHSLADLQSLPWIQLNTLSITQNLCIISSSAALGAPPHCRLGNRSCDKPFITIYYWANTNLIIHLAAFAHKTHTHTLNASCCMLF